MSKNKRKSKKDSIGSTLGFVAAFLVIVMVAGIFMGMSPRSTSSKNNVDKDDTTVNKPIDTPNGEEPTVAEFGGAELINHDFENIEYSTSGYLYQDYMYSSITGLSNASSIVENGNFKLKLAYDESNVTPENGHFGFGIPVDQPDLIDVSVYDYMTFDADYTINEIYDEFQIYSIFRDSKTSVDSYSDGLLISLSQNDDGTDSISFSLFSERESSDKTVFTVDGNSFHLTYVFEFNKQDISDSRCFIYINGQYAFSTEFLYYASNPVEFGVMRHHFSNSILKSSGSIEIDNVNFYTFGDGDGTYDGALTDLFEDTSIKLEDCTDSILYPTD